MAAGNGTLTGMAGASGAGEAAVKALMADVAARFTVLGPPGSGLVAKMLNQLMVGCLHATVAELTAVAEAAGIEADLVPQALAGGHADGVLFQQLYPRTLSYPHLTLPTDLRDAMQGQLAGAINNKNEIKKE